MDRDVESEGEGAEAWSWRRAGALAGLFTALWYLINGYRVGVEDHALLLPLAEHELDPSHLAGDYFFSTTHPTFLWRVLAPLVDEVGVEVGYALLHLLCVFGLGLAIVALARALAGRGAPRVGETSLLALALAAPMTVTLAGIPALDNLLIPRVASLAPLLYAIALAVRGRFFAAFALAGLVFNLHPTTAAHGAVVVGGLWLAARAPALLARLRGTSAGEVGVLRALLEVGAFLLAGLPMLLLTIGGGAGFRVQFPFRPEWYEISTVVFPYHHFLGRLPLLNWVLGLFPWVAWLSARLAGVRSRAADVVMVTIPIFCALGYVLIEIVRLPQAVTLHVFESTRFASFLAPILVARWILGWMAAGDPRRAALAVAVAAVYGAHGVYFSAHWGPQPAALIAPLLLVALAVIGRRLGAGAARPASGRVWGARLALAATPAIALAALPGRDRLTLTIAETIPRQYEDYRFFLGEAPAGASLREASGLEVMTWAADALPEDALVAIPPGFLHPLVSFRLVARRRIFVSWKDGGEAFFSDAFADTWRARMERVGGEGVTRAFPPGTIEFWEWVARTEEAVQGFHALSEDELRALARDEGVTHVVRRADQPLALPELFADRGYRVYAVAAAAGPT
ncbi:MAG: hypothetical protein H6711_24860 [Myxococcales bacterium]|nr:hypothetical protein [Myxococcales bacterium]